MKGKGKFSNLFSRSNSGQNSNPKLSHEIFHLAIQETLNSDQGPDPDKILSPRLRTHSGKIHPSEALISAATIGATHLLQDLLRDPRINIIPALLTAAYKGHLNFVRTLIVNTVILETGPGPTIRVLPASGPALASVQEERRFFLIKETDYFTKIEASLQTLPSHSNLALNSNSYETASSINTVFSPRSYFEIGPGNEFFSQSYSGADAAILPDQHSNLSSPRSDTSYSDEDRLNSTKNKVNIKMIYGNNTVEKESVHGIRGPGLKASVRGGHLKCIDYFLRLGADTDSILNALRDSLSMKRIDIVEMILTISDTKIIRGINVEKLLLYSAKINYIEGIRFFINKGAENLDGALIKAAKYNRPNVVKYLLTEIEKDLFYDGAVSIAMENGSVDVLIELFRIKNEKIVM